MRSSPPPHPPARRGAAPVFWCGLLLLALAAGCLRLPKSKPKAEVKSIHSKPEAAGSITPTVLQARAMRFADEYAMVIAQAAEDFGSTLGTFEARQVAARIKLGQATAAVVDAAGANPVVNALDLVVLASVSRMVAEDYLVGERFGEAAMPLLDASRKLETNAWQLVKSVLKPEQDQQLRDLIADWRRKNPHQRYVGAVRFREFAEAMDSMPKTGALKTSVFSLLFLDPMAGLDPTLRAVEETRYLAERALYYGQRMPILISWQTEYLALQLSDQPAARQMLTNADQLASSLQVFAKTAEQLPQLVQQQREAAIEQFFAGLANERTNLLASLASEEKKTRALLAEARSTLNAAGEMATSVNGAVQSLESFVRYVSPPNTNNEPQTVKTNSRPFDVLDYGTAAGQIGGMAKDLNALLSGLNQSTPQVAQLGQQTVANAANLVMRGFWLGLLLIAILLAGAVLAGLTYRILVNKLAGRARPAAPTTS
ncbi:MAG TPA: hypothetical protein VNH84_20535 [Candidatus Saccharimonadales bacterium]|nr:hypothetical protein [Candidatus Saccharimonadales bacterium]